MFENGFDRFDDAEAVRNEYYAPVAEFVRGLVGARRVSVFDHTIRSKVKSRSGAADCELRTPQRAPVMVVDYTPASGPMRVSSS